MFFSLFLGKKLFYVYKKQSMTNFIMKRLHILRKMSYACKRKTLLLIVWWNHVNDMRRKKKNKRRWKRKAPRNFLSFLFQKHKRWFFLKTSTSLRLFLKFGASIRLMITFAKTTIKAINQGISPPAVNIFIIKSINKLNSNFVTWFYWLMLHVMISSAVFLAFYIL